MFLCVLGTCLGLLGVSAYLSSVCLTLASGAWEQAAREAAAQGLALLLTC